MYNLAVLVGSLRKESLNKKLALALAELGKADFRFDFIEVGAIPLFNEDLEHDLPGPVADLKNTVKASDGVLILTPEYNRDIPGVLKNALDWGSRPYGKGCWIGKCVAVTGMSPGNVGTAVCQAHLRSQLNFLGMLQMPSPDICLKYVPDYFDASGNIAANGNRKFLGAFMTSFADWIKKHQ
jgi:chromate reductase